MESESTPLIPRSQLQLPLISPAIQRLQSQEIATISKDHVLALCPDPLRLTPAEETAFVLVVLLQLRLEERVRSPSNAWDNWSGQRQAELNSDILETRALAVWSQFVDNWCTNDALIEVLNTSFPFDATSTRSITFIQLLCNEATPKKLLTHRLVELAIYQLWKAGHREHTPSGTPLITRMFYAMKRFSTPRVMHALDLMMHLVYLITLVHYVLYCGVHTLALSLGFREIFIITFSLASLVRPPCTIITAHLIVFLSFVVCLPGTPLPGHASFNFVLFSIMLYLVQLHVPTGTSPNPVFLFFVKQSLPLSLFLRNGFQRTVFPVVAFFIPLFLVSFYLLSLSFADTFFRTLDSRAYFTTDTSPGTSSAFFTFFFIVLLIIGISLVISILTAASPLASHPWDRFSSSVGLESRKLFTQVVSTYSAPYIFPTPFNLLPLVFVGLPSSILRLLKKTEWQPTLLIVEQGIWMIFVLPASTIIAGLWLWGYW